MHQLSEDFWEKHLDRRVDLVYAVGIWAAYRELEGPYDLILNGGIFRNFPEYAQAVKALAPTTVNVIFSDVPPVYGSAVEAMHDLGLACTDSFREKFLSSYHG